MEGTLSVCALPPLPTAVLSHSTTRGFVGSCALLQGNGTRGRGRKCRLSPEKAVCRRRSNSSGISGSTREAMANSLSLLSFHGPGPSFKVCSLQQRQIVRTCAAAEAENVTPRSSVAVSSCGIPKCGHRLLDIKLQKPRRALFHRTAALGCHRGSRKSSSRSSSLRQKSFIDQLSSAVPKTLDRRNKVGKALHAVVAGGCDEDDDFDDSADGLLRREESPLLPKKPKKAGLPPSRTRRCSDWILYIAGTAGATVAGAVAAKGIQPSNAQASVKNGGGGEGGGWGYGGGGGGGEGGGGADPNGHGGGTGFLGSQDERSYTKQNGEKSPASVSVRKRCGMKTGEAPREEEAAGRMATLASLSSAAKDFGDGDARSGMNKSRRAGDGFDGDIGYLQTGERSEGGALSAPGSRSDGSGTREILRDTNIPDFGSPSALYSGNAHQNNAKAGEFGNSPSAGDSHHSSVRNGDIRDVPPEFSSIRGKITEIPGYGRDGAGKVHNPMQESSKKSDFFGWLGGFLQSMMGSRTSGSDLDEESKKSLVMEIAARTLQMIAEQPNETGLAKSSETGALRRLQRETFADLVKIRERLSKLEHHSGLTRGSYSGNSGAAAAKTSLKGEVNSGAAFALVDGSASNRSRLALEHAGLLTGLDVRFTFETIMRENDLLLTQCGVGQLSGESDGSILGGPISLQKITYTAQINDTLSVSVSPTGSRASDMADSVNHLQGQALTSFAGSGPALYKHCKGSSIGATVRNDSVLVSMGQYLSGWGSRAADATSSPLCLSTLAQIMIQPFVHMVFSLSAVNNLWPSPPLPSSNGFHWSEMGPLVLSKTVTRPTQNTGTFTFNDLPSSSGASFMSQGQPPERDIWSIGDYSRSPIGSSGTAMQSLAFAGELDLGGHISLGGWAQVERADWLEELEKKDFQWNLSLAKSTGSNVNWGLSVGRRKREDWSGDDGSASPGSGPHPEPTLSQLQMEAFLKVQMGRGFNLQPGLVYILDKDTQTPAFMLRSSWSL